MGSIFFDRDYLRKKIAIEGAVREGCKRELTKAQKGLFRTLHLDNPSTIQRVTGGGVIYPSYALVYCLNFSKRDRFSIAENKLRD